MAETGSTVLRGGTVLTMDDATPSSRRPTSWSSATGSRRSVRTSRSPTGTEEIDASGGIVMPGMIDTHRHMWQTAMRAYGADWTLTQYFVWYYLEHGKKFRPEDIHAGNLLAGVGVAGGRGHHHRRLVARAADASTTPRRPSTRCGPCPAGSCSPTATSRPARGSGLPSPEVRAFFERRRTGSSDMLGFQLAFDVTGDPSFPEKAAFEAARELGLPVTTHAGVWGATNDDGIRLMHEHGFATPETVYVHAATLSTDSYQRIAASGGSVSVSTESEQSAGQGYPPTWQVRRYGIPVSLSMDTSVWWSGDLFSAMRTTLGADRSREHLEAHASGETITQLALRAEQVVHWATRGGAQALGRDDLGHLTPGAKADVVLIKNDHSPVSFPLLNPYGHVAFQAQRGDVHTVLVDGRVVKREGRLVGADLPAVRRAVEATVDHLRSALGEEAWQAGMNPALPEGDKVLDNPYQYTEYQSESTHGARGSIFGEPGSGG